MRNRPNIDTKGNDTLGEGKVAGAEYIAYSDDGSGNQNITMMVQVPASFNPASPCIVTGTSSGSRGIYGAIATSGEWGLKNGCAVAYNDKGTGLGVPPTAGINIINNNSLGGPLVDAMSLSANGKQDYNIAGALCLRELATGTSANAKRVQQGMSEVLRTANLRGKPAVIVHGRTDTLVPVAFTSRPYFGLNKIVEGANSKLSYIEVTNAQHFDSFLAFPGYNARLVPLHRYYIQAMDMMFATLKSGVALPASQVVRTVPRGMIGTAVNPITAANVPPIKTTAAAGDLITFANDTVTIPD